jgi:hypothetical protein
MGDVFGIGAAVQGGTALAGAALQSSAINKATDAQSRAAQNSLDFAKSQYQTQQDQQQPYYQAGTAALSNLNNGLYNGSLANWGQTDTTYQSPGDATDISYFHNAPINSQAFDPNSINITQDPSYQFRLQQGLQALQRSQAATGITGGGAAKAINDYAQNTASTEYGNAYQRAQSAYQTNTQAKQQDYSLNNQNDLNQFNSQLAAYNTQMSNNLNVANSGLTNQSNAYNRLAAMAGVGQTSAQQLGAAGQAATGQYAATTAQLGNALSAGSAAQGSVWGNAVNQAGNAANSFLLNKYGS